MAKRSLQMDSYTPTGTADTTNLVDGTYSGLIQGGAAGQKVMVLEVMCTGQAGASSPTVMQLANDSTVAVTAGATTTTDAPLDSSAVALATVAKVGNFWTTKPQRSATLKLLNLAFNAFGGLVRWVAAPGEEIWIAGASANTGEVSLSAKNVGTPGLMGSHIVYEPF